MTVRRIAPTTPRTLVVAVAASLALVAVSALGEAGPAAAAARPAPATAFVRASAQTGVPAPLLEAVCYLEGRLSMHGGHPSLDNGFGCMHLVKNDRADTLDQAARDLHVGVGALTTDLATNVRGAAMVLRDEARALSPAHRTPTGLAGWYGAVAAYSHAPVRSTALMYAAAAYRILRTGFTARTDAGESLTLAPQAVRPVTATADGLRSDTAAPPAGCHLDNKVDYPGAVDCIVAPKTFDCNVSPYPYPGCTYQSADRPRDFDIDAVVIHETEEGPAQNALNTFQDHNSGVSIHYLVGSDGTVYQLLHEADIAYQDGNFSSNEHTIGIEHAGYDATGWQWFNAAQYLGSAKLVAYLLHKYRLPLDRAHVVAHATVPSENAGGVAGMHVDPGPYWLWSYYFGLIHRQGVPYPAAGADPRVVMLRPRTDVRPYGRNGTETPANFNFFYLYNGPSTASGLIPQLGSGSDVTDVSNNIETQTGFAYLARVKDPAGTGDEMYEVWYAQATGAHASPPSYVQHARLAWLAVPPGDPVVRAPGQAVTLTNSHGGAVTVFGDPISSSYYHLGTAPSGSIFVSGSTVREDGSHRLFYEINYNHRQAWVPADVVTPVRASTH